MKVLCQSAPAIIQIGPFLMQDGVDLVTTDPVPQEAIRISKNGGPWEAVHYLQNATLDDAGWYALTLDMTDTNTLGNLYVRIHMDGCLPVWDVYTVIPIVAYGTIVLGSTNSGLNANLIRIQGADLADYNAVLKLKALDIRNPNGDAIHAECTGGSGAGILARGWGANRSGVEINSGGGGGVAIEGDPAVSLFCDDGSQSALSIVATGGAPSAVVIKNYNENPAVKLESDGTADLQARLPIESPPDPWVKPLPGAYPAGSAGAILGAISGTKITVQSPVASNGLLRLVQGDSYDDGMLAVTLEWHGPDLAGAESVQLLLTPRDCYRAHNAPPSVTVNCSMQIAGHSVTVTIPITDELSTLFEGTTSDSTPNYVYQIVATKGGRRHSLALGSAIVRKKVG